MPQAELEKAFSLGMPSDELKSEKAEEKSPFEGGGERSERGMTL